MNPVSLRTLLGAFLRLRATAYGGPAMMATLRQECVGRRHWLTEQDFKEDIEEYLVCDHSVATCAQKSQRLFLDRPTPEWPAYGSLPGWIPLVKERRIRL